MIGSTALLISPDPEDAQTLTRILRCENWRLHAANSIDRAFEELEHSDFPLVITEKDLLAGTWKDVWAGMQELEVPSVLVVVSRHADGELWSEALNLGAYDVLAKPFRTPEILHLLSHIGRIARENAGDEHARSKRRPARRTAMYCVEGPARARDLRVHGK